MRILTIAAAAALIALCATAEDVYVVPNFHPACCGWLANWSIERNYCGNSYLDHLDRVRDNPDYKFVFSEIPNQIALINFHGDRIHELKQRIKEGRVELVNAFFLEPAISLPCGEALVKMGVEGLRWQTDVLGARPRFCWMIDVCGMHEQMPQIVKGLGLDALVYCRSNPTKSPVHWSESPDGTRVLTVCPENYASMSSLFSANEPLSDKQVAGLVKEMRAKLRAAPQGAPALILGGSGDYNIAPRRKEQPSEFLAQVKQAAPDLKVHIATFAEYFDAVRPLVVSGAIHPPTMKRGTAYVYSAFWIENPRIKTWYRRDEMALEAAEKLASGVSLKTEFPYPTKTFYDAWLQMLLNMDRNTLWGSAGGMVFETPDSWDVKDRLTWVEEASRETAGEALKALAGQGAALAVFEPITWKRSAPLAFTLPAGKTLRDIPCEAIDANRILCNPSLQTCGVSTLLLVDGAAASPMSVPLPDVIETQFYAVKIDAKTGALVSLRLKDGNTELLSGPANVVVAEKVNRQEGDPGDFIAVRNDRKSVGTSSDAPAKITIAHGPISTTVTVESDFYGGKACRRVMRFYENSPRIDCEVDLEDIPDKTVVVVEFPLAGKLKKVIRGIPYGFSEVDLENARARDAEVAPWLPDIVPAIQWSDSMTSAAGLAILDRGLTGRELHNSTPILYLMNATDYYRAYPNAWLSGAGKHHFEYALVPHAGEAADCGLARLAWEYNMLPVAGSGREEVKTGSFVETSDRLILEGMRREGPDLELRLAEWTGQPEGKATVTVNLPHQAAAITDLNGQNARPLAGGPAYEITVRPQQIVTLRLRADAPVPPIEPRTKWDDLVPEQKRAALNRFVNRKGHPPHGDVPPLPDDAESAVNIGAPAKAGNVYHNDPAWAPGMAMDANPGTRWATDDDVRECEIEVELEAPIEIRRAFLSEGWDRVQSYELQYDKDGAWTTFYKGGLIGKGSTVTFPPITVQRVRLHVLEATGGPTLWEFLLFKE